MEPAKDRADTSGEGPLQLVAMRVPRSGDLLGLGGTLTARADLSRRSLGSRVSGHDVVIPKS
jgi:hypothetical protein